MDRRTERKRRAALAKNIARARAAGPTPLLACGCEYVIFTSPGERKAGPQVGFRKGMGGGLATWAARGMRVVPSCPVHGDEAE